MKGNPCELCGRVVKTSTKACSTCNSTKHRRKYGILKRRTRLDNILEGKSPFSNVPNKSGQRYLCERCRDTNYLIACGCECGEILTRRSWVYGHLSPIRKYLPYHHTRTFENKQNFQLHTSNLPRPSGKRNPMWKYDNASRGAKRRWARTHLPKLDLCQICKMNTPCRVNNISGEYKRDLSDWQWLCIQCFYNTERRIKAQRRGSDKKMSRIECIYKRCRDSNYLIECLCGCGGITTRRYGRKQKSGNYRVIRKVNKYIVGHYAKTFENVQRMQSLSNLPRHHGEKSSSWKGDNATHQSIRDWAIKYLPKPITCECGIRKTRVIVNISGDYSRDLSNWQWMCNRCYRIFNGEVDSVNKTLVDKKCKHCGKITKRGGYVCGLCDYKIRMNDPEERKRRIEVQRMNRRARGIPEKVCRNYLCKRCKETNWLVECLCGCGEIFTRRTYYRYSKLSRSPM